MLSGQTSWKLRDKQRDSSLDLAERRAECRDVAATGRCDRLTVDLLRLIVMYEQGGLYSDVDRLFEVGRRSDAVDRPALARVVGRFPVKSEMLTMHL